MVALRLLPALAAGVVVLLAGLMVRELGGGRFAQALAGIVTALAPVYVATFGYLSMNCFDVVFWAACALILMRLLRTGELRWWLPFGIVAGVGLENKISPLFLGFGVVVGLLLTRDWRHFRSRWLWFGGAAAGTLFVPYVIWQTVHEWPMLEFMRNATQYKNLPLSPVEFISAQALNMNPLIVPLALVGLAYLLFFREGRAYRALGWAVLAILVLMITQRAKPYYFAPVFPVLFVPGAVAIERWVSGRRKFWLRPAVIVPIVVVGLALVPLAKPVLPVERFVAYQSSLGLAPGTSERNELDRLPQFFADRLGWRELAETVAGVYERLDPEDRERACIFGQNYGQAGAIDFYGREWDLPTALSGHNTYHVWGPRDCSGDLMIVIGDDRADLERLFDSVELADTYTCSDCMPYENNKPIWVARSMRLPVEQLWPQIGHFE